MHQHGSSNAGAGSSRGISSAASSDKPKASGGAAWPERYLSGGGVWLVGIGYEGLVSDPPRHAFFQILRKVFFRDDASKKSDNGKSLENLKIENTRLLLLFRIFRQI